MMSGVSTFRCPLCGDGLVRHGKTFRCSKNHSYDIARQGYVNLLLANQKGSREPGDSPDMLRARRRFLTAGYYSRLAETVTNLIIEHIEGANKHVTILDAGCGEGYYTEYIYSAPGITEHATICGIDISREGIKLAAKRRNSGIQWGVAGVHSIPLQDGSVDVVINIFAPHDENEFSRVTAENGILISVTPGPEHLLGLKEEIYDDVQMHDNNTPEFTGFSIEKRNDLKYEFTVNWPQIKSDLLQMTPYYWRTKPERIKALEKSPAPLTTLADFRITIYKRNRII